ncbi:hypothetical protein [Streptomyces sp. NPDC002580]|uniref:hypothetical protein n=1 Tax=Streptomyces sp. NPDC002580 TaxID=3364653 RepID=UPI0036A5A00F
MTGNATPPSAGGGIDSVPTRTMPYGGDTVTPVRHQMGNCSVRKAALTSLIGCLTVALAACSGNDAKDGSTKRTASSAAPSPSTSAETIAPPNTDAEGPIERAYRRYWDEKVAAYAKASVKGTSLKTYAVAEAYAATETEVNALKAKGLIAIGKPTLTPKVTSVNTKRQVPQGLLTDCTDVSQWKLIRQSSGEEVTLPKGRLTQYVTKVVAEKWYGHWVIVKVTPEEKPC